MKNWSPEHTKEIKAWLDIDNYRKLEDISLNALYHELWARALLYKPGPTDEEKKGLWVYMTEIFSGNPHLFKGKHLDYPTVNDTLYSPPHIFITDITRLAELSVMALSVNLFTWEEGNDEYCVNAPHHEAYVSQLLSPLCEKTVLLEIDLGSGTDDEIAESIKAALLTCPQS